MNKRLSRRDFLKLAGVTSASLALSACGVKATELPTATLIPPTGTPLPTETLTPTLTSTPTTPLEQLPLTQKAFTEFVQAFQTVGVNVSTDQLIQKGLEVRTVTDKDEKQYDIAFVLIQGATTQLDGDYPLMIKTDGIWKNIGLRSMSSIPIGTSTIWDLLDTNKSEYNQLREKFKEIYSTDFNAYTFQMGWKHIQPENQDKTNFDIIDWQLKQLKELGLFNGINNNLSAQSLIYAKESPDWLKNGNFSREQMIEFMTKYIKSVMTRYKGIIKQWIVVNEPAGEDLKGWVRTDDFLYSKIGADYIDIAFQIAREADPSAILIFNDTDNHTPTGHTTSNTRSIANRLKEKGLVDVVGTQMHVDASKPFDKEKIIETQISYEVPVYVTELDVDLSEVKGTEQERLLLQAQIYQQVAQACVQSGACKSITFWESPGDKFNWLENYQNKPNAEGTLYSDTLERKAAYYLFSQGLVK